VEQENAVTDSLLTIKQAAARLALGRTTVYQLIAKHELKAIKIGRARRIPESALEEWIRQQVDEQGDDGARTMRDLHVGKPWRASRMRSRR
jgi:excisionase family DNA binding protein